MKELRRGKIINLSGGGATAPLPQTQRLRRVEGSRGRLTETLAEELRGIFSRRERDCSGSLEHEVARRSSERRPDAVGKEFYQKSLKQRDSGGVPLEKAARFVRLPCIGDQRRNYRETDQRAMGSVGKSARVSGATRPE